MQFADGACDETEAFVELADGLDPFVWVNAERIEKRRFGVGDALSFTGLWCTTGPVHEC